MAPVDQDFRSWVTDHADARTAGYLSVLAGVYTFYHDPGELSAAFVWERTQRLLLTPKPPARFIIGGWTRLVEAMERHARSQDGRRRITIEGELIITSQRYRDQDRNRKDCLEKLHAMIAEALQPPRPRKATRPSRASHTARLRTKKHRSNRKTGRRQPPEE